MSGKNDSKSRIGGTVSSSIYLMMQGVQILRIHDVNEIAQGLKVFKTILKNSWEKNILVQMVLEGQLIVEILMEICFLSLV